MLLHRYLYRILYKVSLPSIVFFRQDIFSEKNTAEEERRIFSGSTVESFIVHRHYHCHHTGINHVIVTRSCTWLLLLVPILVCVLAPRMLPATVNIYIQYRETSSNKFWEEESTAHREIILSAENAKWFLENFQNR